MQNISCDKALTLSNLAWSEWTERLVIEIIIIVNVILLIMNAHSVLSKMKLSNISKYHNSQDNEKICFLVLGNNR